MGRFNMAAKINSTIAEIYETESPDKPRSIKHHQVAADFYKGEEAKSSATKCLIRVAQVCFSNTRLYNSTNFSFPPNLVTTDEQLTFLRKLQHTKLTIRL
jgi:hypothetical protein